MALSIQDKIGNIVITDAYAKVTGVNIRESGSNENGKLYSVQVIVNYYSDGTKEYSYKQLDFSFSDVQATSFTVGGMYELLKTNVEFVSAIDL